jgi:hypothetical protein
MEALSPVFAALGNIEFDVLNDLSHWLDGPVEPIAAADKSGWPGRPGDVAGQSAGWEG